MTALIKKNASKVFTPNPRYGKQVHQYKEKPTWSVKVLKCLGGKGLHVELTFILQTRLNN